MDDSEGSMVIAVETIVQRYLPDATILGIILLAVFAYGSIRLFTDQGKTVTVAASSLISGRVLEDGRMKRPCPEMLVSYSNAVRLPGNGEHGSLFGTGVHPYDPGRTAGQGAKK